MRSLCLEWRTGREMQNEIIIRDVIQIIIIFFFFYFVFCFRDKNFYIIICHGFISQLVCIKWELCMNFFFTYLHNNYSVWSLCSLYNTILIHSPWGEGWMKREKNTVGKKCHFTIVVDVRVRWWYWADFSTGSTKLSKKNRIPLLCGIGKLDVTLVNICGSRFCNSVWSNLNGRDFAAAAIAVAIRCQIMHEFWPWHANV